MKTAFQTAIIASSLLALGSWVLGSGVAHAQNSPSLPALQGAWVEQSMTCNEVYQPAKGGMAFRKDVSVFAPAMIISGRRISTPGASCSIQKISTKGDRMSMSLHCTTSITTSPVKAYLSISGDGFLYRYNNDTETVGSRYESCKP